MDCLAWDCLGAGVWVVGGKMSVGWFKWEGGCGMEYMGWTLVQDEVMKKFYAFRIHKVITSTSDRLFGEQFRFTVVLERHFSHKFLILCYIL